MPNYKLIKVKLCVVPVLSTFINVASRDCGGKDGTRKVIWFSQYPVVASGKYYSIIYHKLLQ